MQETLPSFASGCQCGSHRLGVSKESVSSVPPCLRESPALAVSFSVPSSDLSTFAKLPESVRSDVRRKLAALAAIDSAPRVLPACKAQAALMHGARGFSAATLRAQYYAFKRSGDWRVLIDHARAGADFIDRQEVALPAEFIEFWRGLCERNQRKCRPARRELLRIWTTHHDTRGKAHKNIPGYPAWPEADFPHNHPRGWSEANLYRLAPTHFELTAARIGRIASSAIRPQVFTTRAGLAVGQYILFDDQEYDVKVNFPGQPRAMRPLGLNALDLFSACAFAYSFKPTLWNAETESKQKLKERDMLWFVVHVLTSFGFRDDERGTQLVVEHGTAAIREGFEQRIFDATHGRVRVQRSGIGGAPSFDGLFEGDARGNFRFKAALESLFNLVRNEMAMLPGNVGLNRHHSPEELGGRDRYNNSLIRAALALPPERAALLRLPFMDWSQFTGLCLDIYARINARIDHDLEGWAKAGLITSEWRLNDQQPWLTQDQFLALPSTEQAVARQLIESTPSLTRARKLAPVEVFSRGARELQRAKPFMLPILLGLDFGVERTVKNTGMIEFEDSEVAPGETFRYLARPVDTKTALTPGEKYLTFLNPFAPEHLIICDAAGRYLGACPRWTSPCRSDLDSIHRQMGQVKAIESALLAPVARRGAELAREKLDMHRHNTEILRGERPVTPRNIRSFEGSVDELIDSPASAVSPDPSSCPDSEPSIDEIL